MAKSIETMALRETSRSGYFYSAALLVVTAVVYAGCLQNGFVNYDDDLYVSANPHVQQGLSWEGVRWAFTSTDCANWHPLTWLSLQLDTTLFGKKPWGYHLSSLLLQCVNSVLLFHVLNRMTRAPRRSAFVAAFFAVHPLHVESVAWVAERKDVLCGLFFMLALLAWHRYVLHGTWRRYAIVLLLLALGLMAKPMLVTFPFVLLLLDWWPLARWRGAPKEDGEKLDFVGKVGWDELASPTNDRDSGGTRFTRPTLRMNQSPGGQAWQRLLLEKLPLLALVLASCVLTYLVQTHGGAVRSTEQLPLSERLINTPISYLAYLGKTVWPVRLAVYYPHPERAASLVEAITVAAILIAVSLLEIICARRCPYLFVGWFWWLGMLVPVVGIVQVGSQAYADRYMYLPMVGLLIAMVWGVTNLTRKYNLPAWISAGLAALSLLGCMLLSQRQVGYWRDSTTLWIHAVEITVPNPVAFNSLGVALDEQGQSEAAMAWLKKSLELAPEDERTHLNLAQVLFKMRRPADAKQHYLSALKVNPTNPAAHFNLGLLLELEGNLAGALAEYRAATQANASYWRARLQTGKVLLRQGHVDEANRELAEAVRLNPSIVPAPPRAGKLRSD